MDGTKRFEIWSNGERVSTQSGLISWCCAAAAFATDPGNVGKSLLVRAVAEDGTTVLLSEGPVEIKPENVRPA